MSGVQYNAKFRPYWLTCKYCGREWFIEGTRAGFVISGASNHEHACGNRTPAQRIAHNRQTERRWALHPPAATVKNNPHHPGLTQSKEERLSSPG